jgi:hypothetical protein
MNMIMMKYIIRHFSIVTCRREEIRSNPFFGLIFIEFTRGYNKPIYITITYFQLLDTNLLIYDICRILSKGGFTVFIKLRYYGYNYKMCGDQICFNYNDFNDFIGLFGVVK